MSSPRQSRATAAAPAAAWGLSRIAPADVVSQITAAIIAFFTSIWNGIQGFFGNIFGALSNAVAAIFNAPVSVINASWQAFQTWVVQFGPLAPLLTTIILAAVFILAVWLVWLIVKLSVSESESIGGEVEEGA